MPPAPSHQILRLPNAINHGRTLLHPFPNPGPAAERRTVANAVPASDPMAIAVFAPADRNGEDRVIALR